VGRRRRKKTTIPTEASGRTVKNRERKGVVKVLPFKGGETLPLGTRVGLQKKNDQVRREETGSQRRLLKGGQMGRRKRVKRGRKWTLHRGAWGLLEKHTPFRARDVSEHGTSCYHSTIGMEVPGRKPRLETWS